MNTHNVKSTYLRTDGFVRNIHSSSPFDVVRADVVLRRLEEQAHRGCGLLTKFTMRACWRLRWIIWRSSP